MNFGSKIFPRSAMPNADSRSDRFCARVLVRLKPLPKASKSETKGREFVLFTNLFTSSNKLVSVRRADRLFAARGDKYWIWTGGCTLVVTGLYDA